MNIRIHCVLAASLLLSILFFPQPAQSCGCGLALVDEATFKELREDSAYLFVDVKNRSSYEEKVYFRFVSLNGSKNMTVVFPLKYMPENVTGGIKTLEQFKSGNGIYDWENARERQDAGKLAAASLKAASLFGSGIAPGTVLFLTTATTGLRATGGGVAFEFEGGRLEIYNTSAAGTLEELIRTLKPEISGKVKEITERYKDYYVGVLTLYVPDNAEAYLDPRMPPWEAERVNELVSRYKGGGVPAKYARLFEKVKGNLVSMEFSNDKFFYPTSIAGSYEYPIMDEKYFVRVPESIGADIGDMPVASVVNQGGHRWYELRSSGKDLAGGTKSAGFEDTLGDAYRKTVSALNEPLWIGVIGAVLWFLGIAIPVFLFKEIRLREKMVQYILWGALITGVLLIAKGKRRTGLCMIGIFVIFSASWLF